MTGSAVEGERVVVDPAPALLRAVLDASSEAVVLCDARDDRILLVNAAAAALVPGLAAGGPARSGPLAGFAGDRAFTEEYAGRHLAGQRRDLDAGHYGWFLRDRTEDVVRIEALEAERARTAFLAEAARRLSATLHQGRTLRITAELAVAHLADAAVVVLPTSRRQSSWLRLVSGGAIEEGELPEHLLAGVPGLIEALNGFPPIPSRWLDASEAPEWLLPDGFGPVGALLVTPLPGNAEPAGALVLIRRAAAAPAPAPADPTASGAAFRSGTASSGTITPGTAFPGSAPISSGAITPETAFPASMPAASGAATSGIALPGSALTSSGAIAPETAFPGSSAPVSLGPAPASPGTGAWEIGAPGVGASGFSAEDEMLARIFAARAGAAISAAGLYREQVDTAAVLQADLLPPDLPEPDGFELVGSYQPAKEAALIGGDFYDVFGPAGGSTDTVIALGDVCGTGPEAAVLTGKVRQTLRALRLVHAGPESMLRVLNQALLQSTRRHRFVTLVVGSVTRAEHGRVHLDLATGGHPPPLVLRVDGTVEEVPASGTLIGAVERTVVRPADVDLAPGELCLLYSDGLTEARGGPTGTELYGEARLHDALASCAGLPATAAVERVRQLVSDWVHGGTRDDIAMLAVRAPARTALSLRGGGRTTSPWAIESRRRPRQRP